MEKIKKPPKPKKQVKNYELHSVLGSGAYADVYICVDPKTKQLYAAKCIPKEKLKEELDQKTLRREIAILRKMKHKNIIYIQDYEENKKNHYIFLEYCNGGNLYDYTREYIKNKGHPLNECYIQKIIKQLAPALEYMHENNIIHRDMKLENILLNFDSYPNVTKDGFLPEKLKFEDKSLSKSFSIKIADLGYAKDISVDNMGSTVLGSPLYMSPDMLKIYSEETDKKYNTSVDLWSLGVITYELLTGNSPFVGRSVEEIYDNIKKGTYQIPKDLKPSIELISFINGLLQVDPNKRLNWQQIKAHKFLTKDIKDFTHIQLERIDDKKDIQLNSNNMELWTIFQCKIEKLDIGQILQKEHMTDETNKKIDKAKIKNEAVEKALENDRIEKEKEKENIKKMKIEAEKKLIEAKEEKLKREKEQENLNKQEEEIIKEKEKLKKEVDKNNTSEEKEKLLVEINNQLKEILKDKDMKKNELEKYNEQIKELGGVKQTMEEVSEKLNEKNSEKKNENEKPKQFSDILINDDNKIKKGEDDDEWEELRENDFDSVENFEKEEGNCSILSDYLETEFTKV